MIKSVAHTTFRTGRSSYLVSQNLGQHASHFEEELVLLLELTSVARTLDQHLTYISSVLPGIPVADQRRRLKALWRRGYLKDVDTSRSCLTSEPTTDLDTLAIITADRPVFLQRALTSVLLNLEGSAAAVRVIVFDGSRQESNVTLNQRILRTVRKPQNVVCQYYGLEQRRDLEEILVQKGFDRNLTRFAIAPHPSLFAAGANRNAATLATAGSRFVAIDDDVVVSMWRIPTPQPGVRVCNQLKPVEHHSYSSRKHLIQSLIPMQGTVLAAHHSVLGHHLRHLHEFSEGGVDYTNWRQSGSLVNLEEGSVDVTSMGIAGDSAIGSQYNLLLEPDNFKAIPGQRISTYDEIMYSREKITCAPLLTLSRVPYLLSTVIGINNIRLIPPFSPLGRNEDSVFAMLLLKCQRRSFIAHLPQGLLHAPRKKRELGRRQWPFLPETRINDTLSILLASAPGSTYCSEAFSYRQLGLYLEGLADLPETSLHNLLNDRLRQHYAIALSRLDQQLRDNMFINGRHESDIVRYKKALVKALCRSELFLPSEVSTGRSKMGMVTVVEFLSLMGRLMQSWPEMWQVAKLEPFLGV